MMRMSLRNLALFGLLGLLGWAIALPIFAAETAVADDSDLPQWKQRVWSDFPVLLELDSTAALEGLLRQVPLAGFDREQIGTRIDESGRRILVFKPRVTEEEAAALTAAGFEPVRVPDLDREGRRAVEREWSLRVSREDGADPVKASQAVLDYYPTYTEIGQILEQLAMDYPAICRTFSWGTSIEGRQLYGLVISADVQNTAAEPEVRLSSSIHGDEPVGLVMLLDLAEYLAGNYGQTGFEDVTALVDGTEIHIMPLHNPDGYVAGIRNNASDVDLNRNYPEPAGTYTTQEIENTAFMNYALAHHFVISENAHTGALVVNYPWDYTYTRAPDDLALIELSLEYSTYNLPMYDGQFDQGITNGADWYVATGTLQDWAYSVTDCMDLTVELYSISKWPNANRLAGLWDDNRESLLHFIRAAGYGVNGVVTDAGTGLPLAATITVAGKNVSAATDPQHGDYYQLLETGTWDLAVAADGYVGQLIEGVNTVWGTPTVLDVALAPDSTGTNPPRARFAGVETWPNPFNAGATIRFENAEAGAVSVDIYNVQGRLVRSVVSAQMAAGEHFEHWDGRDDSGRMVGSGLYFARMKAGPEEVTAKLVLAK